MKNANQRKLGELNLNQKRWPLRQSGFYGRESHHIIKYSTHQKNICTQNSF